MAQRQVRPPVRSNEQPPVGKRQFPRPASARRKVLEWLTAKMPKVALALAGVGTLVMLLVSAAVLFQR
ncbi:hypothetical protein [Streptomyces vastus]|uniref:Uncharacterized protein n=1 Tax=Streptomyces vastus TaxID=285451 RepID=A0ABN3S0Q5_9ACTN